MGPRRADAAPRAHWIHMEIPKGRPPGKEHIDAQSVTFSSLYVLGLSTRGWRITETFWFDWHTIYLRKVIYVYLLSFV